MHLCDCGAPDCPTCGPTYDHWREHRGDEPAEPDDDDLPY